MKVGTDAVLLGAWAPIRGAKRILDVGTGSGIVALMLAQRSENFGSHISAIDIDRSAAEQSAENFLASPWPGRLPGTPEQIHHSVAQYAALKQVDKFDLIVTNPPYFVNSYLPDVAARSMARHMHDGFQHALFECCKRHLKKSGRLCLIVPINQADSMIESAKEVYMALHSKVNVKGNDSSAAKRVLMEFGFELPPSPVVIETFTIESERHQHTQQYAELTRRFHLRYQQ